MVEGTQMGWISWALEVPAQGESSANTVVSGAPYEAHRRAAGGAIQSAAAAAVNDEHLAAQIREKQRGILARYVCHTRVR
jgi:hypothetical protein